ncbi:Putative membrane protein%2C MmpS family [Mycobacteroides abscessus]|nr:Putative membrane protein%2C MmpS family [Mycobacteroides abscessus]
MGLRRSPASSLPLDIAKLARSCREPTGNEVPSPASGGTPVPLGKDAPLDQPRQFSCVDRERVPTPLSAKGFDMFRTIRRIWMPLLIAAVVAVGGFAVFRVRGIFGSESFGASADNNAKDAVPYNPKTLVYEIFGEPGAMADVNYFNEDAQPTRVDNVQLPWAFKIVSTLPSLSGNIVAQGNGDQIGCRITVNGEIKMERVSTEHNAYIYCLVKSA